MKSMDGAKRFSTKNIPIFRYLILGDTLPNKNQCKGYRTISKAQGRLLCVQLDDSEWLKLLWNLVLIS